MPEQNTDPTPTQTLSPAIRTAIEIAIRIGAIALLVAACLMIIGPFLGIVAWAIIIAIAADGAHQRLTSWLGGRRSLAATLGVALVLLILIIPTVRLSETLVIGAQGFANGLRDGSVHVPAPDPQVADWPVVGKQIYEKWKLASENLSEALMAVRPQLRAVSGWLLNAAGSAGAGVLQLVGSLLIAGVLLARGDERRLAVDRFAIRMAGPSRGPQLAQLANATVRSVVQGILGVAFLQAVLAGLGFLVAGVPGAGLWALLVLVAAVIQIPVLIVMVPPILYAFSSIGGFTAIVLAIWCVAVGLLDNFLKPLLFGRGVEVPSLVIFMGAIGGMLSMGILGLFLGSVVLALGFALFIAWLTEPQSVSELPAPGE